MRLTYKITSLALLVSRAPQHSRKLPLTKLRSATKTVNVQFLKPDVALVHVDWTLRGDRDPDGTPRPPRGGVFTRQLKR